MQIVHAGGYDVILETGLIERLWDRIPDELKPERALIVTGEAVGLLYGDRVQRALERGGAQTTILTLKSGGYSGTLNALKEISARLSEISLQEGDAVIALGGGVLCDMAGYAVWNSRQKLNLIQMPTSLMGIADWAVNGKTALEHRIGSHMLGSFFPPSLVLVDPQTVASQPDKAFAGGMAEIIKCACAADASLFHMVESLENRPAVEVRLEEIAWKCLQTKASLQGVEGQKLMLGHHLGHVIETAQRYRGLSHGEAVGIGMLGTAQLGELVGFTTRGTVERVRSCLAHYGLPTTTRADRDAVAASIRALARFDAPVPERVGWSTVCSLDSEFLSDAWRCLEQAFMSSPT